MKKILYFGLIVLMSVGVITATVETKPVYADFFGIPSWNRGLSTSVHSEDDIKDTIWTVVANIADALATLASYVAAGYIILGGYKYMFARGDPGKIAEGKKTLFASFIGLTITVFAKAIVNTILYAMLKGNSAMQGDATAVFNNMVDWVVGIAGLVAAIFLVYGGVAYMTSAGDAGKLVKAKNTIIYALIGMLIVGLATVITGFVKNKVKEANQNSFVIENTIAKEIYE